MATGDGLSFGSCLDSSCIPSSQTIEVMPNCAVDFKNSPCSTNTCFSAPGRPVCTTDYGSSCPAGISDVYEYTCNDCTVGTCGKCLQIFKNGNLDSNSCIGATCNSIVNANSTVLSCN